MCCNDDKLSVALAIQSASLGGWEKILFLPVWNNEDCTELERRVVWYFIVNGALAHSTGWLELDDSLPVTLAQSAGEDIDLPNGVTDITDYLEAQNAILTNGDEIRIYAQIASCLGQSAWSNPVTYNVVDPNATCQYPLLTYTHEPLLTYDGLCLLPYEA